MKLLEPLDINGMVIPNRVMVPAMVTRLADLEGTVNRAILERYERYAQGGIGLIVVEAMAIHGAKSGQLLRISEDRFIPGHRELVDRVHGESDSKVVPQIIHFLKIARSGWRQTIDMLSVEEIDEIVEQFGAAAARAREAGYDGMELHAAHAYTLASFFSKLNTRSDEYGGRTLENRLRMIARVVDSVRRHAGRDFPVGVRFLAEECVKDGYTVEEAKLIALRLAQLDVAYISLSVGGKFEDAVHQPGRIVYPYTGYSGDRCMPGGWYPPLPNAHLAAAIKAFINDKGYRVPVISAGKISDPDDAERLLQEGRADVVALARQNLTDPDWIIKVRDGRTDQIVRCVWCNVCKRLDENHKPVNCFLWPKGAGQAPRGMPDEAAPGWGTDSGALAAVLSEDGAARLSWSAASGAVSGYDVYRADDAGEVRCIEAVKGKRFIDRTVLGGMRYVYYVRAFDTAGRASRPSNSVALDPPVPAFVAASQPEMEHG